MDKKRVINISDVNKLASFVLMDDYYDRRNLILIWLRRFGISVKGRRQEGNEIEYERLKKRIDNVWGKEKNKRIGNEKKR